MRYRLMATYLGVPYYAGLGPDGGEATLFSPAPPPDELGFTAAGGYWRKQVSVTDLDALWQSRLTGEYRGEPCLVLDDLGDRLHIAYQGRDSARARQLGYWEIDREVFEVVVARQDVTGLTEERVEYPLDAALFPTSNRDPVAQARPEAPPRDTAGPQTAGGPPSSAAERTRPLRVVPRPGTSEFAEPGPDRSSSTPHRVAAWHGSPEAESWPGPQPDPWSGPPLDPRTDPRVQARPDPRDPLDPRTEPRPGPGPGSGLLLPVRRPGGRGGAQRAAAARHGQRARQRVARTWRALAHLGRKRFEVLTAQEVTQTGTRCSYR